MKVQSKQIEVYGGKNPEKNLIQQARLLEDTSLRGLHRVISRCVQALAVVDLLHSLQMTKGTIKLHKCFEFLCSSLMPLTGFMCLRRINRRGYEFFL
jgi:hypothetical protein